MSGRLIRLGAVGWLVAVSSMAAPVLSASSMEAPPPGFPFHNGDRVVFLGDSITEQRLYTTYIETYLLTRFPNWDLQFRNAGWGGDTSWLVQRRLPFREALQRDVLDLHPTVVTIDFSMNDAGYGGFRQDLYDQHYHGEQDLVRQMKAAGVRPVVLTVSAVEKNEPGNDLEGYNQTLEEFAAGDQAIASAEGVQFADQIHPFIDAINRLRAIQPNARLSTDAVHPGNGGHLMMADFILTGLGAPPLVSSAVIDASSGRARDLEGAQIMDVQRRGGGVTFKRLDDALVFPIEPAARPVLQIVPVAQDLDRYLLKVTHLNPGTYLITVNNAPVTRASAEALADGVNLAYYNSPLMAPGLEILHHVYDKNNIYFNLWRGVRLGNAADKDAQIANLSKQIADHEQQINALRKPAVYDISVMPVPEVKAPAPSG